MGKLTRRRLLALGGAAGAAAVLGRLALPAFFRPGPVRPLSGKVADFVARCFDGLDRSQVWDVHVHLVGLGRGGSGCEVDPRMQSHLHPLRRLRYDLYMAAAGVRDDAETDAAYLRRLVELQRAANPEGALVLLAFDRHVREDGTEDRDRTPFYTPNPYVLEAAKSEPCLEAGLSIHPYRPDAVERLRAGAAQGARLVKWLPAAMGIDPASPRCDAFYSALAELDLPLLSHAGTELAVETGAHERLGNPLRLRRALDAGVRVIVAHCAGLGRDEDLDAHPPVERESFELFLRLLAEPRYAGRVFGDISMTTAFNRCCGPLAELLRREDLHPALLNGSDYPVAAIFGLVSTRRLVRAGLLGAEDRRLLNLVFEANPLLFDFCVKRCLRSSAGGRTHRFANSVFETRRVFA